MCGGSVVLAGPVVRGSLSGRGVVGSHRSCRLNTMMVAGPCFVRGSASICGSASHLQVRKVA
jgi:hypothetical protein